MIRHPEYQLQADDWRKWRLTYEGGSSFIEAYLKQLSARETAEDFAARKLISYNPAFAKASIDEIRNAIFQRISDVSRVGGSQNYQRAVRGQIGGVDRENATMMTFIGENVLPELLVMSKVAVFVDMPANIGRTLAEGREKHPYLYTYPVEDICSWKMDPETCELTSVLLREWQHQYDPITDLPYGNDCEYYRLVYLADDGFVHIRHLDDKGNLCTDSYEKDAAAAETILKVRKIPLVISEIPDSLMKDIADYQIALLNLASSDMNFAIKANFPFYTEQFIGAAESKQGRTGDGTAASASAAKAAEIKIGVAAGRRYPTGADRPGFIHPSPEPLKVSMEKQREMKAEIRMLVHLSVANLDPAKASAESKATDEHSLENGLAAIGLVLQKLENRIAEFWAMFENSEPAEVRYPTSYSLQSEEDRRKEVESLIAKMPSVPSKKFQKEVAKMVATKMLSLSIRTNELDEIHREIEDAKFMTSDPDQIVQDAKEGLVSLATASIARGYDPSESEKAAEEHAARLARIAVSQTQGAAAARGIPDAGAGNASAEKIGKPTRGEAK